VIALTTIIFLFVFGLWLVGPVTLLEWMMIVTGNLRQGLFSSSKASSLWRTLRSINNLTYTRREQLRDYFPQYPTDAEGRYCSSLPMWIGLISQEG
jgi:hypothetical protein